MTLPNKLTILRMILAIPFIVILAFATTSNAPRDYNYNSLNEATIFLITSGIIFVVAMITDLLDGYLARKHQKVTIFGQLFDPIADKFITTSALILLTIGEFIPFYLTLIFILRDLVVDGTRTLACANKMQIGASIWGKLKTILMTIAIAFLFFLAPFGLAQTLNATLLLNIPLMIASLMALYSGWKYVQEVMPLIKKSR